MDSVAILRYGWFEQVDLWSHAKRSIRRSKNTNRIAKNDRVRGLKFTEWATIAVDAPLTKRARKF